MEVHDNPRLYAIRHSLAHILAQAVQKEFPGTKLGFGPPTDTGFFYDFDFGEQKISDQDLSRIEKRMQKIIREKQAFQREDTDLKGALEKISQEKDSYKYENILLLKEKGVSEFSFYTNGPFLDLCEGPHVENTEALAAAGFKLDRLAGAYWLGNEKNKMLTRIYGLAFETQEDLQTFLKRRENALKFDHKKLGVELELFSIEDIIGKGLIMWLPHGNIIKDEVEKYAKEMEFKGGYKRVSTPVLAKRELYLKSQHLPAYEESMFPPIICKHSESQYEEQFYLRPMNCPHHHLIFAHKTRSYRDLPLRLAEYGNVFRYEQSGELSGLLRVRGMCTNDAHIYCRFDQIEQEMKDLIALHMQLFDTFKLRDYSFRLSLRDKENKEKYKGSDSMWDQAESILKKILVQSQIPFRESPGEAAFYGPKIDIQFKNLMGREETVSTVQLDFLGPINFDLKYIDEAGLEQKPVVIHRSPLSTHERFISYLIEYYGGAFPTWLAPVQVVLIPVNSDCHEYCEKIESELTNHFARVEIDKSDNSFGKKIRTHTVRKIPILLIVGKDELEQNSVTVRRYGVEAQPKMGKSDFIKELLQEIQSRSHHREVLSSIV